MFNVGESGLFYNIQPSKTLTYTGDTCHGGTQSKQRLSVLLDCSVDGTEKLLPPVTGKYNKPHCFRNVKKLPTKYTANSNSWMTSTTFEEILVQLDCQIGTKKYKNLAFIDQCAAHTRDTTALQNIEVTFFSPNCTSHLQTLDMGIIHTFKCLYRKQLIRKSVQ